MFKLLHMSDLHFGPPFNADVGEEVIEAIDKLKPDVLVASGDFTQNCAEEEFLQARQFLDRLPGRPERPLIVCPGNHDVPAFPKGLLTLGRAFSWYRQHINDKLNYSTDLPAARIVSLNTTHPLGSIVPGNITRRQLDRCREWFADARDDQFRIVVVHHHLARAPDYEGGSVMHNAKRAVEAFLEMKVDIVLGGHLHRAYIGNSLDFHPGAHRDRSLTVVQAGTATSRRGRARETSKNSFNLLELTAQQLRITQYMHFTEVGGFAPSADHYFPRSGGLAVLPDRADPTGTSKDVQAVNPQAKAAAAAGR